MSRLSALLLVLVAWPASGQEPMLVRESPALPPGAVLRLGSLRWRATSTIALTAFRKDGREVVTVGQDRMAIVWDANTGAELRRFEIAAGAKNPAMEVQPTGRTTISRDGRYLAAVGRDQVLRLYDIDTGKELRQFDGISYNGLPALSPDGKRLAVYMQPGSIRVWDTTTVAAPETLSDLPAAHGGSNYGYRLEFGSDGKTLAYVGTMYSPNGRVSPNVVVWDVAQAKRLRQLDAFPEGAANNAVLRTLPAPDHKTVLVPLASSVEILSLADGKSQRTLKDVELIDASTFLLTPDGKELIQLIGQNEELVVWDLARGTMARRFGKVAGAAATHAPVYNGSITPDGKTLAYGNGTALVLVDLLTGKTRGESEGHSSPLMGAYYAPDGKSILTRADRTFCRWDALSGRFLERYDIGEPHTTFLLTRDARWMIATGPNLTLHVIDAGTRQEKLTIPLQLDGSYTFTVAPDSRTLIVLGRPAPTLQMFDITNGRKLIDLTLPPPDPRREESPGVLPRRLSTTRDARFAVGCTESEAIVWDLVWLREVQRIPLPPGRVLRHITFGPDGRTLAIEFYGGEIGLWEVATGKRRRLLAEGGAERSDYASYTGRIQLDGSRLPAALACSLDGRLVAGAGVDRRIRIFDARTGRELGALEGHRAPVTAVSFSPDSTRLVSACTDSSALVWDLASLRARLAPSPALDPARIDALWTALDGADAEKAYDAILALAGDPARSVPFLRERLKPVAAPEAAALARLIADLDAPRYPARIKARQELERMGDLALPALKQALEVGASAEVRSAARRLIEALATRRLAPQQIRQLRGTEVLEIAATAEARSLMTVLAGGAPAAPLTVEAQLALARLSENR